MLVSVLRLPQKPVQICRQTRVASARVHHSRKLYGHLVRVVVSARKTKQRVDQPPRVLEDIPFVIHGRHMDITPELTQSTKAYLENTLADYDGALFLEGDSARLSGVDIRLWKQKAEITIFTSTKLNNVSSLRKGEIYVEDTGVDTLDSVRNACMKLTKKLHKMEKPQFRDRSSRNYWQRHGMGEQGAHRAR
eukprot:TRINITY_DN608_c0_g1_i1.p2 TRINITY_DN608_c0_g1~~TRINITY_DN608_c0_g1_i1.p2  ORF type:complete len:192 (-),score=15.59 TRINITY_DN608_c0_g1_i1:793-1368(-)